MYISGGFQKCLPPVPLTRVCSLCERVALPHICPAFRTCALLAHAPSVYMLGLERQLNRISLHWGGWAGHPQSPLPIHLNWSGPAEYHLSCTSSLFYFLFKYRPNNVKRGKKGANLADPPQKFSEGLLIFANSNRLNKSELR